MVMSTHRKYGVGKMRESDLAFIVAICLILGGFWVTLVESPDWFYQDTQQTQSKNLRAF